jgi:hypothetical protein
MTTQETTEVVNPDEANGPKELREALKREQEKSRDFHAKLMKGAYAEAGLNPDSGLGKAIAKEYDGDPTAQALLEYAKTEYGFTPEAAPEHSQTAAIAAGTQVSDAVIAGSSSVTTLSQDEIFKKARAEGDRFTTSRIKAEKLAKLMGRDPNV